MLIDSHSHLFLEEFDEDREQAMQRAVDAGVTHLFMPNIDSCSIERLLDTCRQYPHCYPMAGLHPTSVNADYAHELDIVADQLSGEHPYVAVGEIGLDFYWERTYYKEQLIAFKQQVEWALEKELPIVVHSREAFNEIYETLLPYRDKGLKGIFHSFTGSDEEAEKLLSFPGFLLGINGIVTFKKSALPDVLRHIPISRIALETDCPYLTPAPYRGRRNESSFIRFTLQKVAEVYGQPEEYVANATSKNVLDLFGVDIKKNTFATE